jgi:hypothetical protein
MGEFTNEVSKRKPAMISFTRFCARYAKPYWRYETGKTSHHFRFANAPMP